MQVLVYGNFFPVHGPEVVARAIDEVVGVSDSYQFRVVGASPELMETGIWSKLARSPFVELMGRLSLGDLQARIETADIVLGVFGNTAQARAVVPNKVVDGLAAGAVVITRDSPGLREFFEPGVHLITINEADVGAMASRLAEAIMKVDVEAASTAALRASGPSRLAALQSSEHVLPVIRALFRDR